MNENEIVRMANEHNDKEKALVLWCHKEINGIIGTYPYGKMSDEIQGIIQDHGIDGVKVYRLKPEKATSSSNPRRLPNGKVVWLHKEFPPPLKLTDTLFSLDYPYYWGEVLFKKICSYFASIPEMNGRWEVEIVDKEIQANWRISASEETYEFLSDHWGIIPDSDTAYLSALAAEQVKEDLLISYEWEQRKKELDNMTYKPPREKWQYIEDGNVIQDFYEKNELAQYIYTSDPPKDGLVELVIENDMLSELLEEDHSTVASKSAKEFLAQYEQLHPLFPPRDKGIQKRLRETRYVMNGENCTAKDMWERCYRPQIDNLIRTSTENHIAALVLMLPCMELVYKLKTGKTKQNWIETLKMFFPASGFNHKTYIQLADLIRNGFVHDGFTKGYVGISSAHHSPEDYSDGQQVFHGMRSETGQFNLLIVPVFFWARVRNRIDSFYKYEQWIPGREMDQVLTISHYVEPII